MIDYYVITEPQHQISIQMQNNKALELEYVNEKLSEQANIENKSGYKLDVGDKVRLIESKHILKKIDIMLLLFIFLSRIS
jgi:hypothetical protein